MLFSLIRAIRIFEQFELQINTESRVKTDGLRAERSTRAPMYHLIEREKR